MKRQLVYVAVLVFGLVVWYMRDQHGSAATAAHAVMARQDLNPWAVWLLVLGLIVFVAGWFFSPRRRKKVADQSSKTSVDSGDNPGT